MTVYYVQLSTMKKATSHIFQSLQESCSLNILIASYHTLSAKCLLYLRRLLAYLKLSSYTYCCHRSSWHSVCSFRISLVSLLCTPSTCFLVGCDIQDVSLSCSLAIDLHNAIISESLLYFLLFQSTAITVLVAIPGCRKTLQWALRERRYPFLCSCSQKSPLYYALVIS